LNLLYDVGFNREVAEDAALYWTKEDGDLAGLIDQTVKMSADKIRAMGEKANARIRDAYSWEYIAGQYETVFLERVE
jgi:rhamnosyltransferase